MDVPFSIALLKAYHAQNNVFRPMIAELGLSVGQPKILGFLTRHDGCMQKELAAMCDIEPATISRLLDKMEADGLISRQTVARDAFFNYKFGSAAAQSVVLFLIIMALTLVMFRIEKKGVKY